MTDPSGHLGLDALADVLAGERDDPHLHTCAACRDRLAELGAADASVRAALAALPPPALPDGLAERLSRALEQERSRTTVRPLRRRPPAWMPAVAASAVLVLAGAVGWSVLDPPRQGSGESSSATAGGQGAASGPEAAAGLALPPDDVPTDWADEAARPAALSRLLGAAGGTAEGAADRTADGAADAAAGDAPAGPKGDGPTRLRDPTALAACLAALPGGGARVLAVDHAQYAGAPAVAVVQADGPDLVRLTVLGSGCSAADPQVLDTARLPRP